ncbi:MAG: sensor histidine kinase, partial [Propylenella sp.]
VLSPYTAAPQQGAGKTTISGPEILSGANAASNLALLLHEFATNAAKYGALSRAGGRVNVDWLVENGQLRLTWSERGGPNLAHAPDFHGFGTRLIDRVLADAFGGEIVRDWAREGLTIRLSVPTDRLRD